MGRWFKLLDLPGLYSLAAATPEEKLASDALAGKITGQPKPTVIVLIVDATNLERNLYLASQVLELDIPTVLALNMCDLAKRNGIQIDTDGLSKELGCPVVAMTARTGWGIDTLRGEIEKILDQPTNEAYPRSNENLPGMVKKREEKGGGKGGECACSGCPFQARYEWAEGVGERCTSGQVATSGSHTERIDQILTHPVIGVGVFFTVMFGVFATIFFGSLNTLWTGLTGYFRQQDPSWQGMCPRAIFVACLWRARDRRESEGCWYSCRRSASSFSSYRYWKTRAT